MQLERTRLEEAAQRGIAALQSGDFSAAREEFAKVTQSGTASPQAWLLLAQSCDGLDDRPATLAALDQVLASDRRNPFALLMKGDVYTRNGDDRAAVSFYRLGIRSAEGLPTRPGDLEQRLERARQAVTEAERRFEDQLEQSLAERGIATVPRRFAEALAIASGRQPVYLQQPTSFYYPGLPQVAWYDPGDFAWVREFERSVPKLRAEVEAVLAEDQGLEPYVQESRDRASRGHSLLNDSRWSALHLWKEGERVEENAVRCPAIMALLETAPMPRIARRSPMALISVLRPGTHIPPHTGLLNTRLICHIPLIVPPGCRLRVGAETRDVVEGRAMIFDDSIEHEAWNDGTDSRAVLLFEIWRPEISEAERVALTAMYETVALYPSSEG